MVQWMGAWLPGIVWQPNKQISCNRATRIPIICLRQEKIFLQGACINRIPITCIRRENIFRRGPRVARILITCFRQEKIFRRGTHVTRIPITCLWRSKIFRRGPRLTRLLISCLWQRKNFPRGPLELSTRQAYFLHYNITKQPLLLVCTDLIIQLCFHEKAKLPLLLLSNIVEPTHIFFSVPFPTL